MTKEILMSIISNGRESSIVDFKREFYNSLSESDLSKDIAAFANEISSEAKVIIFGIDDKTRDIVGIATDSFPSQDNLDEFISQNIEPFVSTVINTIELDNHVIGYIEILTSNIDRPYVIKKDCGKNSKIRKGDLFVRKGSTIQKALREDIDNIYKKGRVSVKIYDNDSIIEPIHFPDELIKTPTYGVIKIDLCNSSSEPILIDNGSIYISTTKHSVCRRIVSILPERNISKHPFQLSSMTRKVHDVLYDFRSEDCVNFGFDSDGNLDEEASIQIELNDTDGNIYTSDEKSIFMLAKGDILHKVQLKEKKTNRKVK